MTQIILASPKVRKFARKLGADISQLKGSERNGRITEEDVRNFIKNQIKYQNNPSKKEDKKKIDFDHSDFGEIEVVQMPRIKRLAVPNLLESWRTIPHVTHHDEANVTELEGFRKNLHWRKKKNNSFSIYYKSFSQYLKKISQFQLLN